MAINILSIGVNLIGDHVRSTSIESTDALLDAEIVVMDVSPYLTGSLPPGNAFLPSKIAKVRAHLERRVTEIKEFLAHGRTFVYLPMPSRVVDISNPTGPSKTTLTDSILGLEMATRTGVSVDIAPGLPEPLSTFLTSVADLFSYRVLLSECKEKPCLFMKGTKNPVGSYSWNLKERVLYLPTFAFPTGLRQAQVTQALQKLVAEWKIETPKTIDRPSWHGRYNLIGEKQAREKIVALETTIREAEANLQGELEEIAEIESFKDLVSANDDLLVDAVLKVLRDFGFKIDRGEPGRDDMIGEYGGRNVVIEVKGRESRGAAEKDAAQLEKWVSNFVIDHDVTPKGVLVVNGYRDIPLEDRKESVFPHQMIEFSAKRDHCLISGVQLLCLYQAVNAGKTTKEEAAAQLMDTVGVFGGYQGDEWKELLGTS